MISINKVQGLLKSISNNAYYNDVYSLCEISYWEHIYQWMAADNYITPVEQCLDIGCGYGTLALYAHLLWGVHVCCTDFVDYYFQKSLLDLYNIEYATTNIEFEVPPWEYIYDVIIFTEVLEHLNFNPVYTFNHICKVLKPGGYLYLSTPDIQSWRICNKYISYHKMLKPSNDIVLQDTHMYIYSEAEVRELAHFMNLRVIHFDRSSGMNGAQHLNFAMQYMP